jgi:hypothetical protein
LSAPIHTSEQRALHADHLLKDYLLTEAFEKLQAAYVTAFRMCRQDDDRGRLRYQDALNDLDAVKSHLMAVVAHGELEAKRAAEFRKASTVEKITRIF